MIYNTVYWGFIMEKDIIFCELKNGEIDSFSKMVNDVFDEFVGKDYSEIGISEFKRYSDPENILTIINNKTTKFFVAKKNNEIIGAIGIRNNSHISLFFVKKEFHKNGIGKKLFTNYMETLKGDNCEIKKITVNSSIYAEVIYSKLGFIKTDELQNKSGFKYIPMEYKL